MQFFKEDAWSRATSSLHVRSSSYGFEDLFIDYLYLVTSGVRLRWLGLVPHIVARLP